MLRQRWSAGGALVLALAACCLGTMAGEIVVYPDDPNGIRGAIHDANNGDVIILQIGTYRGEKNRDLDPNGKAITIRGASNDPALCVLELNDPNSDPNTWQYRRGFWFHTGEGPNTIVSNLTVTGGYAQYDPNNRPGGGAVLCRSTGPRIVNCRFINNHDNSGYGGGAIACRDGANPIIEHCHFSGNSAGPDENAAGGGALLITQYSTVILRHCVIDGNASLGVGGALVCNSDSHLLVFHTRILANKSTWYGTIYVDGAAATFFNCEISKNEPVGEIYHDGRGIYITGQSSLNLTNCTLADNYDGSWQGVRGSAIMFDAIGMPRLTNCIVWRNRDPNDPNDPNDFENALYPNDPNKWLINYSDIQGHTNWGGQGNGSNDPIFVARDDPNDPFFGRYYLSHGDPNWGEDPNAISLCKDAGDPNDATLAALGLDTYTTRRSLGHDVTRVDMGVHYGANCNNNNRPDPLDLLLGNPDPNDPNNDWRYRDCNRNGLLDGCEGLQEPNDCRGVPTRGLYGDPNDWSYPTPWIQGNLVNVHTDDPNVLQRYEYPHPLPYIWIPTDNGQVWRVSTEPNYPVQGKYLSAAGNVNSLPAGTGVTPDGDVWVANRNDDFTVEETTYGTMTRLGRIVGGVRCNALGIADPNGEYVRDDPNSSDPNRWVRFNSCIDRNGDSLIHTALGTAAPLDWPLGQVHSIQTAVDECICRYSFTVGGEKMGPAFTRDGTVWIGSSDHYFSELHADTGQVLRELHFSYSGTSTLVDDDGVLWSTDDLNAQLLRYDTSQDPNTRSFITTVGKTWHMFPDLDGQLLVTSIDTGHPNRVYRLDPNGTVIDPNYHSGGAPRDRGVAVTFPDGDIWVADSKGAEPDAPGTTLSRIPKAGGDPELFELDANEPTGVAIDDAGFVWTTCREGVVRVDPNADPNSAAETVLLGVKSFTMGNMTGDATLYATGQGTWGVIHDGGKFNARWSLLVANALDDETCANENLTYEVRADDSRIGLTAREWLPVVAGKRFRTSLISDICDPNGDPNATGQHTWADVRGRFIEVRVRIQGSGPGQPFETPKLQRLAVRHGLGDLNCDGEITFTDINPFVVALGGCAQYQAAYPCCDYWLADCLKDGAVNFADINYFVDLLSQGLEPD